MIRRFNLNFKIFNFYIIVYVLMNTYILQITIKGEN